MKWNRITGAFFHWICSPGPAPVSTNPSYYTPLKATCGYPPFYSIIKSDGISARMWQRAGIRWFSRTTSGVSESDRKPPLLIMRTEKTLLHKEQPNSRLFQWLQRSATHTKSRQTGFGTYYVIFSTYEVSTRSSPWGLYVGIFRHLGPNPISQAVVISVIEMIYIHNETSLSHIQNTQTSPREWL